MPTNDARPLARRGGDPSPADLTPTREELGGPHEPWGSELVTLRIGALVVELVGVDDRLTALLRHNYAHFVVGTGQEPTISAGTRPAGIEVVRSPRSRWLHLPRGSGVVEEARVQGRSTWGGLDLWSYHFAGSFDRDGLLGRLLLCDVGELDLTQAIENFLRFFVSAAALRVSGFLLHASGVVRDGKAYVFFGPSGAGKSTAVTNSPAPLEALGDDLVLVESWRGGYRACGVPFRGSFRDPERNPSTCAPLRMACRLFHSEDNRLEETSRTVQVAELLGELPFLLDDAQLRERAGKTVARFVSEVPVRRLHLRNDPSFWDVLD